MIHATSARSSPACRYTCALLFKQAPTRPASAIREASSSSAETRTDGRAARVSILAANWCCNLLILSPAFCRKPIFLFRNRNPHHILQSPAPAPSRTIASQLATHRCCLACLVGGDIPSLLFPAYNKSPQTSIQAWHAHGLPPKSKESAKLICGEKFGREREDWSMQICLFIGLHCYGGSCLRSSP